MTKKGFTTLLGLSGGGVVLLLLVWSGQMTAMNARIIGIVFVSILLWATSTIPGFLVSLLFFLMAVTMTDVPTSEIFSGFASSAFWLVFSGTVIGFALKDSGLSQRIGTLLARTIGGSYLRALVVFAILAFVLSLVMPSTFGRIAILVPLALGYCEVAGLDKSRKGQSGILLLVIVGSYALAAAVLPANLPNLIMAGALEKTENITLGYSEYLFYFFPAGVLLRGGVLIAVSYFFFHDRIEAIDRFASLSPWSGEEKYTLSLISLMLFLWFTDAVHHIAPGWVGLGFVIVYFLVSTSEKLDKFITTLKIDLLWFIAAVIGLAALVGHLDSSLPESITNVSLKDPMLAYTFMTGLSVLLSSLVTSNAAPALFVPIASSILQDSAILKMGMLSQVMGYSTTFLPYQSPPVAFGIEISRTRRADALRYCLLTGFFGVVFVMPANALWWKLIGFL